MTTRTNYRPQSVNVNDIVITPLKQNEKNKGSTAYVNHKGGRLRIRTDVMRTPFGASVVNIDDIEKLKDKNASVNEINDAKKFGLSVAVPDEDDNLRKFIDSLDNKLLETAMKEKYVPGMNSIDGYKAVHNRGIKIAIDKKTGELPAYLPCQYSTRLQHQGNPHRCMGLRACQRRTQADSCDC